MEKPILTLNLSAVRTTAEEVAQLAGKTLLNYFEKPLQKSLKDDHFDLVTEADKASETQILGALREAYPDHYFVGEEGGGTGNPDAEYRWYIDPLDGTVNFASTLPLFAVSLALTNRNNEPLVGVVFNPANGELFSGAIGHGATLNGQALHVSKNDTLKQSVLATGFPYSKAVDPDNNSTQYAHFEVRTRGIRRLGACSIDMCYVAKGRFDGYWEMGLKRWDYLAGAVCVLEAGGKLSDFRGEFSPNIYRPTSHIIASNGLVHDAILDGLRESKSPRALGITE